MWWGRGGENPACYLMGSGLPKFWTAKVRFSPPTLNQLVAGSIPGSPHHYPLEAIEAAAAEHGLVGTIKALVGHAGGSV
jgi:hypothetical protein